MPVDLMKPLAWETATGDASAMLSQLQPNILKGHVREHMQVLFVQFSDTAEGRAFLDKVASTMKSAEKHLRRRGRTTRAFRSAARTPTPASTRVSGQGSRPHTKCPLACNGAATETVDAAPQAVTMKGGEHFVMPSVAFLKSLA